jgi:hypothetical protein
MNTNAVFEAAALAEHAHAYGRIGQTVGAGAARDDGKALGFVLGGADFVTTDHHEFPQALDLGGGEFGYRERRRLGCEGDLGECRGIADDMRDKVFDVGARLDEGKAGSGLGLAIARDLARLYGGDLELEKAPGGGLLARLLLPDIDARD